MDGWMDERISVPTKIIAGRGALGLTILLLCTVEGELGVASFLVNYLGKLLP
jgi:hypothetical protein